MVFETTKNDVHFVLTREEALDLHRSLAPLTAGLRDILGKMYLALDHMYKAWEDD